MKKLNIAIIGLGNIGSYLYKFLKKNKKGEIVSNLKSFDHKICKVLRNGDFLMIKGSNATKLHEISKKFLGGSANAL